MIRIHFPIRTALIAAIAALSLTSASKRTFSPREKAFYADDAVVNFVRPGLVITVTGAQIANDGTITATVSITDPAGLPLDRLGTTTPGPVSLSLIAATIPKGQEQYTAYTNRTVTGVPNGVSAVQASADSGGTFTQVNPGIYTYQFATRAPSGFDATATHTIGVYGSRNLNEFNLGTNYASATYSFVPSGAPVTVTRDVVRTPACNSCHTDLAFHGGSRRGTALCILCHTPQSTDPDTGNTLDFKVMVHKIHMGSSLPSVQAGKPYQIVGFQNAVSDWSTVVYPADVRRCETCHDPKSGAAQATAYLTKPSRAACGACHDDVNFATGANHPAGPMPDDSMCATCHIPQGQLDFDASIKGAHVIPTDSTSLSGLNVAITKIQSGTAGSKPVVSFTVTDNSGKGIPLSSLGSMSLTMAGPTSDYGYTSFGSDVTTPGYVTESATKATCDNSGNCMYTFTHAVPASATGTYAIGAEARRTETLLPGQPKQQSVTYGAKNPVMYFSVDGSQVAPRREVVAISNCNGCHVELSLHGSLRNQTEYCVMCHNPSNTDASTRAMATNPADKAAPPQGINFNLLVHRIHTGENLPPDRPYIVVGFGGSHNDFSDVRYPAMYPTGATADTATCSMCHVNSSEQNLPLGKNPTVDPQGPINPDQAIAAACTGCHVTSATASHVLSNTNSLGEACPVCHAQGSAYAVGQVHAQ
jgi:OmcA/MtrC family decaheme c-type cytochrome